MTSAVVGANVARSWGTGVLLIVATSGLASCGNISESPDSISREQLEARLADAVTCDDLQPIINGAGALRRSGQYREAEAIYTRILNLKKAASCRSQHAWSWNGLATVSIVESRYLEALKRLDRAEENADAAAQDSPEAEEDVRKLRSTLELNRGSAFFRLGWMEEARDLLEHNLSAQRGRGLRPNVGTLVLLAQVYQALGDPGKASPLIDQAVSRSDEDSVKIHTRISIWTTSARLELEEGRFGQAVEALDEASEIAARHGNKIMEANVRSDRAELEMRRGNWDACRLRAEEALALAQEAGNREDLNFEAHARYLLSVALWHLGEKERSKRVADHGLALLGAARHSGLDLSLQFFARRQDYFRHRIDLSLATSGPEDLWDVFESYRARGLLENLAHRAGRGDATFVSEDLKEKRKALLEVIRHLDRLGPEAPKAEVTRQEKIFRLRRQEVWRLQAEQWLASGGSGVATAVGIEEAQAMVDSETLVLVFASGIDRVYLLALDRRHGLSGHALSLPRKDIEVKTARIINALDPKTSRSRSRLEQPISALGDALLAPVLDRLDVSSRVVIVADDPLAKLPFEILRPNSHRRLVETHEIVYLPSFSFLGHARRRSGTCPPPQRGLLAVGDPILSSRDSRWPETLESPRAPDEALAFGRLPASADEVLRIAEIYPRPVTLALARDATRDRLIDEAPRHGVIHIASHARSAPKAPERSRIALSCLDFSGQVAEPCDLYFNDAATLDLCGQIVILSACETASGPTVAGEGTLGLPWAFLSAGASTVIASLWRVDDETTAGLMTSFHERLRSGDNPASALRKAKLELIDRDRPPSVWAPFIVVGDGKNAASFQPF